MMTDQREQNNMRDGFKVSRRELLTASGATLVGAALVRFPANSAASGETLPGSKEGWMKEVVLPKPGSMDPVELSIAESRFWNEQMMEHAQFFIMLMPGAELADERSQAERFQ